MGCAREQDRAGRLGEGTGEELGSCTGDSEGTGDRDRGSDLKEISRKEGSGFEGRDRTSEDQAKDSKAVILNVIDQEKVTRGEDLNAIDQEKETRDTRGEDLSAINQAKDTRGEDLNAIDQEKDPRGEDLNTVDRVGDWKAAEERAIDPNADLIVPDPSGIDQAKDSGAEALTAIDWKKDTTGRVINTADGNPKAIDQAKDSKAEVINTADQEKYLQADGLNNKTVQVSRAEELGVINSADRKRGSRTGGNAINTDPVTAAADQDADSGLDSAIDWGSDQTATGLGDVEPQKGQIDAIDQDKDAVDDNVDQEIDPVESPERSAQGSAGKEIIDPSRGGVREIDQVIDTDDQEGDSAGKAKEIDLPAPELDDPIGKGAKATADLEKELTAAHQKVIDPGIDAIDQERYPSKAGRDAADQGAISKDPGGIDRDQVQIDPQQPAIDRSDVPMTEKQTAIGLNRDFKARQRNQFKKPTDKESSIPKILVEDLSSPPLESEKEKKKRLKAERKREKEEAKRRERERKERERRERERQREVERELRERRKERERAREREERKEGGRNRKPPQTRGKTFHVTPAQRDAELVPPSESSKTDLDLETKRHSAPFYDTYF
ncbi:hypothetical protein EOD39_22018 [Acipenser ruthenus]|uniref:Uncharacterized protein n=1 Tax=Acipenser ruthenus TaxID=7906 RepID=A0A444UR28_ACIRT|nr:hypothetical protein EOD39_22018 [Acipenser ruthenus]